MEGRCWERGAGAGAGTGGSEGGSELVYDLGDIVSDAPGNPARPGG